MTQTTFNTSGGGDGRVIATDAVSWATAQAKATGDVVDDTDTTNIAALSSDNFAANKAVGRGFFNFDTSSIPDTDIITSAYLQLDGSGDTELDDSGYELVVVGNTTASNTGLVAADFDQVGSTPYCNNLDVTNWDDGNGNANIFPAFNSTGLAAVSTTSFTKLATRMNADITATAPAATENNQVNCRAAESAGSEPVLVVTHQAAGTYTSADFNGHYLRIPRNNVVDIDYTGAGSFSVQFWMNVVATGTTQNIIGIADNDADVGGWQVALLSSGAMEVRFDQSSGTTSLTAPTFITGGDVGNWVHFTAVFDVAGANIDVYKNGVDTGNTMVLSAATSVGATTNDFAIGASATVPGANGYVGKLDELRAFGKALSPAEITANYQAGLVGNETDLDMLLKFDNNFIDSTSNGNNPINNTNVLLAADTPIVQQSVARTIFF
jgi:hypothetical protein